MQSSWPPAPWSFDHYFGMARRTGPLARATRPVDQNEEDGVIVIEDTPDPENGPHAALPENNPISSYTTSSMIKVTVGTSPNKRVHRLHKALLMEKSDYFNACLNQPMIESHTAHVRLPEDDPQAFDCFVNWAYSGKVNLNLTLDHYIDAYILADKLMMSTVDYPNCLVQAFRTAIDEAREHVTTDHLLDLARIGLTDSDLMRVAIHKLAYGAAQDDNNEHKPANHEWMRLLGTESNLTQLVLDELKVQWQAAALACINMNSVSGESSAPAAGRIGRARGSKRKRMARWPS